MALERCVTEMGMGVDVHGRDYTRAAQRAVSDAIRHSSLSLFKAIGKSRDDMVIEVVIGAPEPDQVDREAVARELPY
ncbi:MAG: Lin0512 family protein, partial [Pseudomonadota bacterium]